MVEPLLFDTVDFLYHAVMDHMPKWLQAKDMASAAVLGGTGAYTLTKIAQWVTRSSDGFYESWMPAIERLGITALTAGPIIYAALDPEGAREIMKMHPTYTSGMTGVYLGSVAAMLQDLRRHTRRQTLEDYMLRSLDKE